MSALWACPDGSGYWIATDQYTDRSVFHLFDRVSLEHRGAFARPHHREHRRQSAIAI